MPYDPTSHHRRSLRLKNFDYSSPGGFFITICTYERMPLLGEVVNGEVVLNALGTIAQSEWLRTESLRSNVILDEFIIMPNHIHGIIFIDVCDKGTEHRAPTIEKFGKPTVNTIPTIIRGYKAAVKNQANHLLGRTSTGIWQKNYYEHVIRDESDLNRIREYIETNPLYRNNDEYFK